MFLCGTLIIRYWSNYFPVFFGIAPYIFLSFSTFNIKRGIGGRVRSSTIRTSLWKVVLIFMRIKGRRGRRISHAISTFLSPSVRTNIARILVLVLPAKSISGRVGILKSCFGRISVQFTVCCSSIRDIHGVHPIFFVVIPNRIVVLHSKFSPF